MADAVIGSSYLQVIPKLETSGLDAPSGAAGTLAGNKFGAMFGKAAKALVAIGVTKALADLGKAALDSYAQYEQLVGGVDTLFKDASDQVQAYAANAYQTAGMSANQYMGTVTGFSASLIQSLGGDTERAAQLADQAITDMADNANKMGSDMESIQNAYQGFAKQNYTMLDNLKLGYGGTKSEMERLLADAEAISGVHYDISSYADVVEAIHVIQDEMGIAGATAEEAASTIEGSVGMMRAAWANWVTGLGNEDADMGELTQQLVDSFLTAAGNVVPRIGVIFRGIFSTIPTLLQTALRSLPDAVRSIFGDAAADGLVQFMKPFMGLRTSLQSALGSAQEAFSSMMGRIRQHLADAKPYIDSLMASVGALAESFGAWLEVAAPIVSGLLGNLLSALVGLLPVFTEAARVVVELTGAMLDLATSAVTGLVDAWRSLPADTQAAWNSIKSAVSGAVNGIRSAVSTAFNAVRSNVSGVVNGIRSTVSGAFNAVKAAMVNPINAAKSAISSAISSIKSIFAGLKLTLPHFALPHFRISGGSAPWGIGGKGSLPSFHVDWYAKGGIVDGATLIGAGERGGELIWPSYEPYLSKYAQGIAEHMPGGSIDYDRLGAAVARALDGMAVNMDGRAVVGQVMAVAGRTARMNGGR